MYISILDIPNFQMAVHKNRPTIRFAFKLWRLALFITNIYAEQVLHKVDSKRQVEGMRFHLLPVSSGSVSRRVGGGDLHCPLSWAGGGTLQNSSSTQSHHCNLQPSAAHRIWGPTAGLNLAHHLLWRNCDTLRNKSHHLLKTRIFPHHNQCILCCHICSQLCPWLFQHTTAQPRIFIENDHVVLLLITLPLFHTSILPTSLLLHHFLARLPQCSGVASTRLNLAVWSWC